MHIELTIDGQDVTFSRNWFTGRTQLTVDGWKINLVDPYDAATHLNFDLTKTYKAFVGTHILEIEHKRPLLFAGFRPQRYRFLLDGKLIAERKGY